MKKTVSIFVLGVVAGYGLSLFLNSHKSVSAPEMNVAVTPRKAEMLPPAPPAASKPLPPPVQAPDSVSSQETPQRNVAEENEAPPEIFNLDVVEADVKIMEDNLEELQKDVSLIRAEEGWIVRFYAKENLLGNLGVKDHDLIRFEHLENLKQDPSKTFLVSRLEALFSHLER